MAKPKFKQRCALCKKNMVVMYSQRQFPVCVECHMKQINQPVDDLQYKELFDIPETLYKQSSFLRNIKQSYLRFGSLTEKQIAAFKKTVEDLKNPQKQESEDAEG